jgi:neutral ceramidase
MRPCILLLVFSIAVPLSAAELRVGASAVNITPPPGTPMAGYYHARAAEGIHDELFAKALVLELDGTRAALVALDLISTTRPIVEEARRQIEETTSIPGGHVMISATHSHTGPLLSGRGLRDSVLGGGTDLARRYSEELPAKIAEAVRQAASALQPARASVGRGREESIAFNRRFHMRDGSVGWNPGVLNPNILKPAGPIDPDVHVVSFVSDEQPLATYVNHAVHLDTVGGTQISADMPYTVSRLLGESLGPETVTVYTTGCCGDVNHINVEWGAPQKGHVTAARMGTILAAEVLRTWPRLEAVEPSSLRIASETVKLPLARIEPGDVEQAQDLVERLRSSANPRPKFLEQVHAFKALDVAAREGQPLEVEVQVVALGDQLAWVSLPGEIFVELGLAIKHDSPFEHTIIAELANGSIGYIPTRRAWTQGNYEVVSARCAEGSGEMLVDAAVRLLKELHAAGAAKAPQRVE